jgi:predicted nucleic acid-binding protein
MNMQFVVDTNVIIAAAVARGHTLDILYTAGLVLVTPDYTETELSEHLEEIMAKSGLEKAELERLFEAIFRRMRTLKAAEYSAFRGEAEKISPDKDDWPFFAVALKERCAIWSNDRQLKKQAAVKIVGTGELEKSLRTRRLGISEGEVLEF